MKIGIHTRPSVAILLVFSLASTAVAQGMGGSGGRNPLKNVYFGEEHLHTGNSPDAFAFGTRNTPDEAYRYAKGEAVKNAQTGVMMMQKKIPYDWCAVTDHAEYLGMLLRDRMSGNTP